MVVSSLWLTGIIVLATIYFLKRIIKWYEVANIVNKIPGPMWLPFIGTAYVFIGVTRNDLYQKIQEVCAKYPNMFRVWVGMSPEVHILRAEHAEKVLSVAKHLDKSYAYDFVKPWLGDGLLISKEAKWHSHRKIITPTFHFGILESYCNIFAEQADILTEKFGKHANTGVAVDICPFITRAALDIICETAMGVRINAQDGKENDYVTAIYDMSDKAFQRVFRPWLAVDWLYRMTTEGKEFAHDLQIVHQFTNSVVEERRRQRRTSKSDNNNTDGNRRAFLDLLLDANEIDNKLSTQDIREEVDTFMFEGHDTTSSGMSFALFCIGNNPHVQEQIFEELDTIFGDSDRPATMKDLNEMKYLERVLKETLRHYPPVVFLGRVISEDVVVDKYTIPKNCFTVIHVRHIMSDPKHFPNPTKFDPDRFLSENTTNRHPYAYIPFSAGPRNCIGQKFATLEEKAVLSTILRKFKVKSAKKPEDLHLMSELILRSRDDLPVYFEKRH